jgi:hypothetical protein
MEETTRELVVLVGVVAMVVAMVLVGVVALVPPCGGFTF